MVGSPSVNHVDPTRHLQTQVDYLTNALRSLANKLPFPFSVVYDPSGNGTPPFVNMFSVVNSGWTDANGRQIPTTTIRDATGNAIFFQAPAVATGDVASDWYWALVDASGNGVVVTDGISGKGLAYPFLAISLYPTWNGLGTGGSPGGYSQILASAITSETVMWTGRCGFDSHPAISIDGLWGHASGSSSNVTYRLYVGGALVGSWTQTPANGLVSAKHIFDIHTQVGSLDTVVSLTAQSSASSADSLACQVLGCYLRQTPQAFG